jgi:hypothetical protein
MPGTREPVPSVSTYTLFKKYAKLGTISKSVRDIADGFWASVHIYMQGQNSTNNMCRLLVLFYSDCTIESNVLLTVRSFVLM